MTMTRTDFTVIAEALASEHNRAHTVDGMVAIENCVSVLAERFEAKYPRFDRNKFWGAFTEAVSARGVEQLSKLT